ncbi:MAG: carotenoid oxygenase family protein [Myxococcota bacterium]
MNVNRRTLLGQMAAAGAALGLPAFAQTTSHPARQCFEDFHAQASTGSALDPWRSVDNSEFPPLEMELQGKLPAELSGTLYRNGPAGFERAGMRYQHWFDGDGMVQAFRFGRRGITHHGRKVATRKWQQEEQAGRFLRNGAGSTVPGAIPRRSNDSGNVGNIAVVPWGDELLALWEAGSPHALDPKTLETRRRVVFSPETDGVAFSAHPLFEQDGRMWNFGLAQYAGENGTLILYALHPGRGLERVTAVSMPFAGYMHSFTMSERWLVFYLAPHVFRRGRSDTYVDNHRWEPERGGRLLLVDKTDFEVRRWFDAPPGFVWHFADAIDGSNGAVTIRCPWSPGPKTMNGQMNQVMCGKSQRLNDGSRLATLRLDGKGKVRIEHSDVSGEFPICDPRGTSPFMVMASDRELNLLTAKGQHRVLRAPGHIKLEEHRFVPRGSTLGDGWLVGTGYDFARRQSVVTVFDTHSQSTAPVALARMDRRLPFGFHGWFVQT